MQYLAILGRQPKISLAELMSLFSDVAVLPGSRDTLATFNSENMPEIARLGGTIKLAKKLASDSGTSSNKSNSKSSNVSKGGKGDIGGKKGNGPLDFLLDFAKKSGFSGKFVLGVSDYSKHTSARAAQGEALRLKRGLKKAGFSARVLPNKSAALSSATVFHNQLGEKPGHFELIKFEQNWYIGIGVQNIKAYAERDQARPARDAKNGMLPPKLAQILINLCEPLKPGARVLDPFCGTGVVLQEALLLGYRAYGTDASERIVEFAQKNLKWLTEKYEKNSSLQQKTTELFKLEVGDATDFKWQQPIDAVAFEGYLGPPMSQIPATIKIKSVISDLLPLYYHTLRNLSSQIKPGTPVVMAVPAFLRPDGSYQRLFDFKRAETLDEVEQLGYNVVKYKNLSQEDLLYFRDGQVVAREIIVLRKK